MRVGQSKRVLSALLVVFVIIISLWDVKTLEAQSDDVTWSLPMNLSNSSSRSLHPTIIADSHGYVHVFWSEVVDEYGMIEGGASGTPNTIFYRRWDGDDWTEPVDILAVSDDPLADFVAVTIDRENQLHLSWTGLTQLYYSTALAVDAGSVRAWSRPQIIASGIARSRYESDIAVDSQGNVHIVYAMGGTVRGVLHSTLLRGTDLWTLPVGVSSYLRDDETAFKDVRLVIDDDDRLHAAWSTSNVNGYSQAVYYARSEPLGQAWDAPVLLADAAIDTGFTGWPALLISDRDHLLLIHVDQGNRGRIERTSIDGGMTWSDPRLILPSMEGVNGFLIPLRDGDGGLHLIINMRPSANQQVGIYYAPRADQDWASVTPVAVNEPYGPSAHYTDATMRWGNEIHIVWTQLRDGEIWYVLGVINDVSPLGADLAFPEPVSLETSENDSPSSVSETLSEPTSLPTKPWDDVGSLGSPAPSVATQANTAIAAIGAAIAPVLLILLGAVIWRRLGR
jgi:hypothetical protein